MLDAGKDPFGWTDDPALAMVCLTFVEGLTPAEILGILSAEELDVPMEPGPLSVLAGDDRSGIRVAQSGGWAVAVELESLVATAPDVLRSLSGSSRRAVQVTRTGSGMEGFGYWCDGELLCQFDPISPATRTGRNPDVLVTEMRASGLDPSPAEVLPGNEMYWLAAEVSGVVADTHLVLGAELSAGLVTRRRRRFS
ncbi:DUF6461 domain-containing protein [Amycolatopsis sp. NPDC047767]|uniref:DUF6461 domain-containing protein n=1 Tax=Amycolatopsis sp. NPDC047767 TaxID=3156765 RepID=UPI00345156D8